MEPIVIVIIVVFYLFSMEVLFGQKDPNKMASNVFHVFFPFLKPDPPPPDNLKKLTNALHDVLKDGINVQVIEKKDNGKK